MLAIYEAKIETYIKETRDKMPFNIESEDDVLNDSLIEGFFEDPTWKSIINKRLSDFSKTYNNDPYIQEKNIIPTLQKIRDLNLTYPEFKNKLRKDIQGFLNDVPNNRKTSSYKASLIEILKLLENRFNKILLITGESGTGKTHLINRILNNYNIKKGLEYYSICLPLLIVDNDIEKAIIKTLNMFFDTKYQTLLEFNQIFSNLKDISIKVFFIIDDLQNICLTDAFFYKSLKENIEKNTVFDWINWSFSINEFDQYLIIDDSNFLIDYCYYIKPPVGNPEADLSNIFINMHVLNSENNTFEKILKQYDINIDLKSYLPTTNSNNINMFRNNPLMCHVYANTANDIDIEFMNICYLDFIKRYAEIKKKSMVAASRRNLSYIESKEAIEQDITAIAKFLVENKKLKYTGSEFERLFLELSESYYELRSVQLIIQNRSQINDQLSENGVRTSTEYLFMFKLFWAFKILSLYRENEDWGNFADLRKSFVEIRSELLIYELLYLDIIENYGEIEKIVKSVLRDEDGKELLFFVFIKMNFTSQAILYNYLLNEEKIDFNRSEVFGLLYFLSKNMAKNVKIPDVFIVINRYINDISENNLGLYLESVVQRKLERLDNLNRLKKCITQFISCSADEINKGISKIAATNFHRVISKKELNLENIIKQIITYLKSKTAEIEESNNNATSITFIEYFLRYLFTYLIKNSANKMEVHEILRRTDDYFMEEIKVAHILRRSVTVSYGYIYRSIKFQEKESFKRQYLNSISNLIDSGNILNKKLAFHLIVDTLQDYKNPNIFLEKEFINLLKRLYYDKSLEEFNNKTYERRDFIERNLS